VLHSGLTKHIPIDIGQALVKVRFVVRVAWVPLREIPGLGTILYAVSIGPLSQALLPAFLVPTARTT
jgi:uncharacterized membrane protein YczE